MLDPLTALGLAANVVQLIDFTATLLKESHQLVRSAATAPLSNTANANWAKSQSEIRKGIKEYDSRAGPLNAKEMAVRDAVDRCNAKAAVLIHTPKGLEAQPGPNGLPSRRVQFAAVFRTRLKQSEIGSRQKDLEKAQNGLTMALVTLMRRDQMKQFEDITKLLDCNLITNTEALLKSKTVLLQAVDLHSKALRALHQDLSARHDRHDEAQASVLRETVRNTEAAEGNVVLAKQDREDKDKTVKIRESLRFPQIDQRREDIAEAAPPTFSWVLSDGDSDLRTWLKCGSGIFWIRGKPGSGKSTLIKYLTTEDKTIRLLEEWAGNNILLTGEHYFWYPGTMMQKSHIGLYRSLLNSILSQDLSDRLFIRTATPSRWKAPSCSLQGVKAWSREELFQGLMNIGSLDNVRICLFIDGLDEYHLHGDHNKLLRDLKRLAALPNIKLCVSSRPWDIFERSLTSIQQMIVLEDMTLNDIIVHVWDELENAETQAVLGLDEFSSRSHASENLVELIANRSCGVFLWVHLILQSLSERIAVGQSIHNLRRYVDDFPQELETYFRKLIYERISPTWRQHSETACALKLAAIVVAGNDMCGDRSFLNYWMLKEENNLGDPSFAKTRDCEQVPDQELEVRLHATVRFLDASCKDLLRITKRQYGEEREGEKYVRNFIVQNLVDFMHRTVYDFILTAEMQRMIDSRIPAHFHDAAFIPRLALARLKSVPVNEYPTDLCVYHSTVCCSISDQLTPSGASEILKEADKIGRYYSANFCNCGGQGQQGTEGYHARLNMMLSGTGTVAKFRETTAQQHRANDANGG